jgi:hypothetical protein
VNGRFFIQMVRKTLLLFIFFNVIYVLVQPLANPSLTLYNRLFPGRLRFVWTDKTGNYLVNETLLPRLLGDHIVSRPKADNEYRIVVLGSSETWGFLDLAQNTMPVVLDSMNLRTPDGRRVRVYNLAYVFADAFKDMLILKTALDMGVQPDLILLNTNISSYAPRNPTHWLSEDNADLALAVIKQYHIESIPLEPLLARTNSAPSWWRHSFVAQRSDIAAWLTNQVYGFAWSAIHEDYPIEGIGRDAPNLRRLFDPPLTRPDVIDAIAHMAQEQRIPLYMIETPVNFIYSDSYRSWLEERTRFLGIPLLNCSALLPPLRTHGLHFDAEGQRLFADEVASWLEQHWENPPLLTTCPDNTGE